MNELMAVLAGVSPWVYGGAAAAVAIAVYLFNRNASYPAAPAAAPVAPVAPTLGKIVAQYKPTPRVDPVPVQLPQELVQVEKAPAQPIWIYTQADVQKPDTSTEKVQEKPVEVDKKPDNNLVGMAGLGHDEAAKAPEAKAPEAPVHEVVAQVLQAASSAIRDAAEFSKPEQPQHIQDAARKLAETAVKSMDVAYKAADDNNKRGSEDKKQGNDGQPKHGD